MRRIHAGIFIGHKKILTPYAEESGVERAPMRDEAKRKLTEREMNTSAIPQKAANAQYESAVKWESGKTTK